MTEALEIMNCRLFVIARHALSKFVTGWLTNKVDSLFRSFGHEYGVHVVQVVVHAKIMLVGHAHGLSLQLLRRSWHVTNYEISQLHQLKYENYGGFSSGSDQSHAVASV